MDITAAVQTLAIMAFAMTGVIAVSSRRIDLFSACVLGTITALGGGTTRDVILGVPVFWSLDLNYIWASVAASLLAFIGKPLLDRQHLFRLMLYLDGFCAALFAVQASNKVWDLGFGIPVAPIILGIVTAIGGGLIRDVLSGHPTLLMNRDLYAIPVLLGCTLYVLSLALMPEHRSISGVICISLIFGFRSAVIHWGLTVPHWLIAKPKDDYGDCRKRKYQIAPDLPSSSRSDNRRIAGLCNCYRDTEDGWKDKRDGIFFSSNRLTQDAH